jgi:CRISPR-associated exonuclease Cas4
MGSAMPLILLDPTAEDALIPLSALQHYLYCPRQCALIHVERQWAENLFTAEGRILHERSEKPGQGMRGKVRTITAMPIRSFALGVTGIADIVELHRVGNAWKPYPVEYKRGAPKVHRADEVQLCAQALCLEEMFKTEIGEGALFYGKTRRRKPIVFDAELRHLTQVAAAETRSLIAAERTPAPVYEAARCRGCSLAELCWPQRLSRRSLVAAWIARRIDEP